jgi:serine/threonine-protein kinase
MADVVGRVLGNRWRVDARLSSGGTATVYRATDLENGSPVAVKMFHPELAQHPKVVQLLMREARVVGAVDHPGTVKVYDDGVEDGSAYIVFELLIGQSLEKLRQARGGRVPLDEVMTIGNTVMAALAAVHKEGIVHRDLKPDNIHVLDGGGVKLLDFGFAKKRGNTADAAQSVVGTASFMPPEAALGLVKKVDARSDIWSLGATLFFVLSGQSVHVGEHLDAMLLASAQSAPRSLATAAPELPSKVVAVIDRALAFHKADRWQDVESMQHAWQEAHPHWLPTLPPPRHDADEEFLDASHLEAVPASTAASDSLFDPRREFDSILRSQPPPAPAHPGPIPRPPPKKR